MFFICKLTSMQWCTHAGYWPFGLALCAVWQIADVTCCTSSIMHLCTISLDRYAALRRPLVSHARRPSVAVVWMRVGFVWTLSFGVASPLIVVGLRRPAALLTEDRQCFIGYAPFLAYGSLVAFFCPLAVMLATYALTTRLLRRRAVQAERLSREGSMRRTTSQRRRRGHDNSSRLTVTCSILSHDISFQSCVTAAATYISTGVINPL